MRFKAMTLHYSYVLNAFCLRSRLFCDPDARERLREYFSVVTAILFIVTLSFLHLSAPRHRESGTYRSLTHGILIRINIHHVCIPFCGGFNFEYVFIFRTIETLELKDLQRQDPHPLQLVFPLRFLCFASVEGAYGMQ